MIDKHLDAPSKWKSHMQTNTGPTDEDNCNVYQRNNDTGKSLPPPPLQAQSDQTQIDHANIIARDNIDTGGRREHTSTNSHAIKGLFAVDPKPSRHPSKIQTPSIPQMLNETDGKHGLSNRLTPKTSYSKLLLNTAKGGTRGNTKLDTDNDTTWT